MSRVSRPMSHVSYHIIPYPLSLIESHLKGIFLLLDAAALPFAAAVLHLRYAPTPLYDSDDVVATALLPVVTVAVDGLWVTALCVFHLVSHHRSRFSPCSATGSDCYLTFITLSLSSRNQSASYLRLLSSLYCILVSARYTSLDRATQFPDQPLPYIYTWTSLRHHSLSNQTIILFNVVSRSPRSYSSCSYCCKP